MANKIKIHKKGFIFPILFLAAFPVFSQVDYTVVKLNGGRVSFCPSTNKIAYDRPDTNGYYNVYVTDTNGIGLTNITNKPEAPQKHNGCPEWHPDGKWMVFQSQIDSVPDIYDPVCGPGIGVFTNIWVTDSVGSQFWQLTAYPYSFPAQATLHPHFSPDGTKLLWSHLIDDNLGPHGHWLIHIADFSVDTAGAPSLQNIQTIHPGATPYLMYESHGFSPGGDTIYFSSPMDNTEYYDWDIYAYGLTDSQLTNLTHSLGVWDEHTHVSPDGTKIVWSSSQGTPLDTARHDSIRLDWWMMDIDGSNKKQISHFNTPGYPEYTPGRKGCSDFSWGNNSNQFYGFLQSENSAFGSVIKVEFEEPLHSGEIENGLNQVRIFPNPVYLKINVELEKPVLHPVITIMNVSGQILKVKKFSPGNHFVFPCKNIKNGVYFLQIEDDFEIIDCKRIVIFHDS